MKNVTFHVFFVPVSRTLCIAMMNCIEIECSAVTSRRQTWFATRDDNEVLEVKDSVHRRATGEVECDAEQVRDDTRWEVEGNGRKG